MGSLRSEAAENWNTYFKNDTETPIPVIQKGVFKIHIYVPGGSGELLFNWYRASVLDDKKFL